VRPLGPVAFWRCVGYSRTFGPVAWDTRYEVRSWDGTSVPRWWAVGLGTLEHHSTSKTKQVPMVPYFVRLHYNCTLFVDGSILPLFFSICSGTCTFVLGSCSPGTVIRSYLQINGELWMECCRICGYSIRYVKCNMIASSKGSAGAGGRHRTRK
jgi:hypothetical protein